MKTLLNAGAHHWQNMLCCSGHSGLPALTSAGGGLTWFGRDVQSRDSRPQLLPLWCSLLSCSSLLLWGFPLGPYRRLTVGARHTWAECLRGPAATLSCIPCRQTRQGILGPQLLFCAGLQLSASFGIRVRQDGTGNSTLQA